MTTEGVLRRGARSAGRWLVRAFRWHVKAFVAFNAALALTNAFIGTSLWAFWVLFVTGLLLTVHYFAYKVATVDEQWAEERTEELNLKSYDRGHIEDLKSRFGTNNPPGDPRR